MNFEKKKTDTIIGGVVFLVLALLFFLINNIIGLEIIARRFAVTILFTAISFLLFGLVIPGSAKLNSLIVIYTLIVCIAFSIVLYLFVSNELLLSILVISVWLIGGFFILFKSLREKTR